MNNGNTIILTYGTFDLLHHGHIRLLNRAKALGDYLIVAVSTDEFNRVKGKECIYRFEQRKFMLEHLSMVDEVIQEDCWDQKAADVVRHNVDVFVMGNDWEGKFDELKSLCEVIYLPRTEGVSTSETKLKIERARAVG